MAKPSYRNNNKQQTKETREVWQKLLSYFVALFRL